MTHETVLELRDVEKRFGELTALSGLSLRAQRGKILALLGPNGAGKSTAIDIAVGFQRPDRGTVRLLGENPAIRGAQLRTRTGIMLQGGGAYSSIRVGEMMRLAASYTAHPLDPEWLMRLLGLDGLQKQYWRRLSGGQQQRLSFALAMVGRPDIIILDEPTAGVDTQARAVIWELIGEMTRDGVAVILTTHLMDEAESLADDIVILNQGRVVATGTPADLTSGTRDYITVVTDGPLDSALLADRLGLEPSRVRRERPHNLRIFSEATPELVARLAAFAAEEGVLVEDMRVARRTLEDVFLDTTGRTLRR